MTKIIIAILSLTISSLFTKFLGGDYNNFIGSVTIATFFLIATQD